MAGRNKAKPEVSVKDLRHWHLLGEFREALDKAADPGPPPRPRPEGGPERLLTEEDYLCSFLFALFNPVIDSMRGLCACTRLERVQSEVSSRAVSLGSFSEAQGVFGYGRLEAVFEGLTRESLRLSASGQAPGLAPVPWALRLAVDSTVFRALPRMCWAQWRHQNTTQRAVRLHLKFNVVDGEPAGALVTEGRRCERKAFAGMVQEGEFYVGDRNYGRDYKLLKELEGAGCGYIMRLCENAHMTLLEELPLSAEDRAAGVVYDRAVDLGARGCWHHGPVRVLRIEKPGMAEPLLLVTNQLDREVFSAALCAEIYRKRWTIELFFRWFKCVLGRPGRWNWLAESPSGAAIQVYLSLIAALLLSRRLCRLPSKRCMEMLRFHSMGVATTAELEAFLARELRKKPA